MDYNSLIAQYQDRQQSLLSAQDNMKMKFDDFISERDALKGARDQAGAMIGQGLIPAIEQATKLYTIAKQVKGIKALGGMLKDNETLGNIKDWFNKKMGTPQPSTETQAQAPAPAPAPGTQTPTTTPTDLPPPPAELLQQPTEQAAEELPPPPEEEAQAPAPGTQVLPETPAQVLPETPVPTIPDLPDLPGIGMPPPSLSNIPVTGIAQYRARGTTLRRIQLPDQPQDEPVIRPARPQLSEPTMSQFDDPEGQSSYTFGLFRSSRVARATTTLSGDDEFGTETRPSIQYVVPRIQTALGQAPQEQPTTTPGFLARIFGRRQVNTTEESPQIPDIADVSTLPQLRQGRAVVSTIAGQGQQILEQGTQAVENTAQAGRNIGTAISGALSGDQTPTGAVRSITNAGQTLVDSLPDEWVDAIKSVLPSTAGEAIGTGLAVAGEIAGLTEGILQIKESFQQAKDIDAEQTDLDQEASQMANHPIFSWGKQALDNYDSTQGQPVISHF